VPSRRTLATGILPFASLGELLASPSWLRSVSQRRLDWGRFTSRRLGMGPCHLAGRSLRASCPPLARGKPRFAILAALGFPTPARLGEVHLAQARGGPVPSRRTLSTGILPSARSWETSLHHPGCARFPNAGSIGTGPPLANPYSLRADAIKAPRREPGGRRAVGPSRFPKAREPSTTKPPNPRSSPLRLGNLNPLHAEHRQPIAYPG